MDTRGKTVHYSLFTVNYTGDPLRGLELCSLGLPRIGHAAEKQFTVKSEAVYSEE